MQVHGLGCVGDAAMIVGVNEEGVEQVGAGVGIFTQDFNGGVKEVSEIHFFGQGENHVIFKNIPIEKKALLI